jgi:3D-(3,5/4)-trihydroxycyclohexane-1,2-dione acylhydrolase (decyclizing)
MDGADAAGPELREDDHALPPGSLAGRRIHPQHRAAVNARGDVLGTIRLTAAEAVIRFLAAQRTEVAGRIVPLFGGVFAIFGHGNVAGLGPALQAAGRRLPTFRAHNEQAMAHAAIAYAKAHARRRMMACTSSIGPGATNMVTAAAVAHVNRLPVLFLPGDVFAGRGPDPVLQQVEHFGDPTLSANDCFRPVSRFFDRITRPEQILSSLPAALRVLTDPAECGPATIAFPQDVQTEALEVPEAFLRPRLHRIRAPEPDARELAEAAAALSRARRPLVIAGGGVKYAGAEGALAAFAEAHGLPVAETQAGKGSLAWDHPCNVGGIGVTGAASANALAAVADLVLAIGTRLQDFTTGSRALFPQARLIGLNVAAFDAAKHGAQPLVADAGRGLAALGAALGGWRAPQGWTRRARSLAARWQARVERLTAPPRRGALPTDAQVLGAVNRALPKGGIVVAAAGGLPGELHKLWRASDAAAYHLEYGFSCMGYEIAGGLGAKLAMPEREVVVLLGDGSYLMMNSEIATSVALGARLTVVLLDNRGFGCIHRLQKATGGAPFNNLLAASAPAIDFAAHARSLGAEAHAVEGIAALEAALPRAFRARRTTVLVVATDPEAATVEGGAWWDVPVTSVPRDDAERAARAAYEAGRARRRHGA